MEVYLRQVGTAGSNPTASLSSVFTGLVAEWLNATVLKTVEGTNFRGFESLLTRQCLVMLR